MRRQTRLHRSREQNEIVPIVRVRCVETNERTQQDAETTKVDGKMKTFAVFFAIVPGVVGPITGMSNKVSVSVSHKSFNTPPPPLPLKH